ncbi:MAG: NifU family protein [Nitrospirae bacterium]|nr:NifU family protein [Nitrospirota bacterium]
MELKQADTEIKIKAEVLDAERCKFVVDRPVFRAGGSLLYLGREKAKESPLAEKLFQIEGVTAVQLAGNTVTIAKKGAEDWTAIGKKVGKVIRAYLQSEAASLPSAISKGSGADLANEERIKAKIQNLLDTQINPGVGGHGGYVSLLDVKGTTVYIKMSGGCQGCGMASVTLKQGIEKTIRQFVPEVTEILDTTDHASGRNPYYAPSR